MIWFVSATFPFLAEDQGKSNTCLYMGSLGMTWSILRNFLAVIMFLFLKPIVSYFTHGHIVDRSSAKR